MSLDRALNINEPFAMIAYQAQAYSFAESIDFWNDLRIGVRMSATVEEGMSQLREDEGNLEFQLKVRGALIDVSVSRWKDLVVERYDIRHLEGESYLDARDLLELKLMEGADFGMAGGLVAEIGSRPEEPRFQVFGDASSETRAGQLASRRQQISLTGLTQALFGAATPFFRELFRRQTSLSATV